MRSLFFVVCALIVYGSLFPFDFVAVDFMATLGRRFESSLASMGRPTDLIGNIILFLPYGVTGVLAFGHKAPRMLTLVAGGLLLALLCQLLQVYLPSRTPALVDVVWNLAGMALGISYGLFFDVDRWRQRLAVPATPAHRRLHMHAAAFGLLGIYLLVSLSPWRFSADAGDFHWLPFAGLLTGSMIINVFTLLAKVGLLTAAAWMLRAVGWRGSIALVLVPLALTIELLQLWMPGKFAGLTNVLAAGIIALIIARLPLRNGSPRNSGTKPASATTRTARRDHRAALLMLGAGCAVVVLALAAIPHLPGVPYNALEMFAGGGMVDYAVFALALASMGIGPALAGRWLARTAPAFLVLPFYMLGTSVITYVLLDIAVTDESMHDIIGTTEFLRRVTQEHGAGARLIGAIGPDLLHPVVAFIEPWLRFSALVMPLLVPQVLAYAVSFRVMRSGRGPNARFWLTGLLLAALLMLALAKLITIDGAATDNLTELLETDGALGVGGWLPLYVLGVGIGSSAVAMAWTLAKGRIVYLAVLIAVAIVTVPLGWVLLTSGLADTVYKYGEEFSAVGFLLGPDRTTQLPELTLFLRWGLVQLALTGVLAYGGAVYLRWVAPTLSRRHRRENPSQARSEQAAAQRDPDDPNVLVNFTSDQLRFVDEHCAALGQSRNALINTLVHDSKLRMDSGDLTHETFSRRSGHGGANMLTSSFRPVVVQLDAGALLVVSGLANHSGISRSRAIRRLVALAMEKDSNRLQQPH
ncbi:MAG: VanZ family protein [Gammaproteobacteria bacterium]|nr:VanZ family protein [Gammaproteobacteria bacterium]